MRLVYFIFVSFQLDVNNASPEEAEAYRKKLMNDANRMDMAISALFGTLINLFNDPRILFNDPKILKTFRHY